MTRIEIVNIASKTTISFDRYYVTSLLILHRNSMPQIMECEEKITTVTHGGSMS